MMKSPFRTYLNYFNLFYIAFCIIWQPLQIYILKVDGAGRTIILLSVIAFLLNWKGIILTIRKSVAAQIWCALTIYAIINSLIKGFVSEYGLFSFMNSNFLSPLVFLLVSSSTMRDSRYPCVKTIVVSLVIYLIFGVLHLEIDDYERMLSEMGNMLPLTCVSCFFFSSLLWVEKEIHWWGFASLAAFCLLIIILSATRKAFGAYVIILIGTALSKRSSNSIVYYVKLSVFVVLLCASVYFLMNNTLIGERIRNGKEYSENFIPNNPEQNDLFLTLVGDRSGQYVQGTQVFLKNPITGIGICNYTKYTGASYRLHTEYMVQLCENGIIGFVLLWMFYYFVWKNIKRFRQQSKSLFTLLSFGLLSILFINLTAWTYNGKYIMLMYAIMFCPEISKHRTLRIKRMSHYTRDEKIQIVKDYLRMACRSGKEKSYL